MNDRSVELPPQASFVVASFAAKVLADFKGRGGSADDLFAAFVGLVSARNKQIGAECIIALEEAIREHDSART
jgi:hypothetical protein